jgi:hypothetical protein
MTKYEVSLRGSASGLAPATTHNQGAAGVAVFGSPGPVWPLLPWPRGPLSEAIISALGRRPGTLKFPPPVKGIDVLTDDDFGLALYLCYEQHYQSVADSGWEWDMGLLLLRAELERAFMERLHDEIDYYRGEVIEDVVVALDGLLQSSSGPSLSGHFMESGTLEQLREFCVHRSAYQLKEADPHTFAIPRLAGEAKAALVEIQFDEYGSGDVANMHSTLFADTMKALGLDSSYGSYVEILPGITLATVNLVSMFGLHRRWRGALVGHLAVFEMTSIEPMGRYSAALARFGIGPEGRRFYDVHVAVDEVHAVVARDRLVAGLVRAEPNLGADVLFGAAAVLMLEQQFTRHLLDSWSEGRSSLSPWEVGNPLSDLP